MRQSTHATEDEFAICCSATCSTGEVGQSPTPPRRRCPFSKRLLPACMGVNCYREITLHTITYAVITISAHDLQLKARDMTHSWYSDLLHRGDKHFRFLMTDFHPKFPFFAASSTTGFQYICIYTLTYSMVLSPS